MTPGPVDAIAPGAPNQLGALLAALAGAALVAGLLQGTLWIRHRRRVEPAVDTGSDPRARPPVRAVAVRRLLGVVLVAAIVLPTAAATRQLWPHPDLGARLIAIWLPLLLLPAAVWLLTRGDRPGRPRS